MTFPSEKGKNPQQAWQSRLGLWGAWWRPHANLGNGCASASRGHKDAGTRRVRVGAACKQGMRLTRLRVLPYGAAVCVGHSVLSVYLIVQGPPPPVLGGAGLPTVGGGEDVVVGGGDLVVVGGGEVLVVGGGEPVVVGGCEVLVVVGGGDLVVVGGGDEVVGAGEAVVGGGGLVEGGVGVVVGAGVCAHTATSAACCSGRALNERTQASWAPRPDVTCPAMQRPSLSRRLICPAR